MTAELITINNAAVLRDVVHPWRWLDAWGPNVVKWFNDFTEPVASADTPVGATVTLVEAGGGDTTLTMPDGAPSALLITTDGNEDDGANVQWLPECFKFDYRYPTYFGAKFKINDVDQTDILIGLAVTDTTLLGGVTDGVYLVSVDGSATLNFTIEDTNVESSVAVGTLVDDAWMLAEWYYDGATWYSYLNGIAGGTQTLAAPADQEMCPSLHFLTGEATANTCYVDWIKAIQIREV